MRETWHLIKLMALMHIVDKNDDSLIQVYNITHGCSQYHWGDWSYTGTVSQDKKTIVLTAGSKCQAYRQSLEDVFELLIWDSSVEFYDTGDITFTEVSDGVWQCSQYIWLYPVVTQQLYTNYGTQAQTWTKNSDS